MKSKSLWLVALCLWTATAFAGNGKEVYSWVDAKGARHYSDQPPVGVKATPIKVDVSQPRNGSGVVATTPVAPVQSAPVQPTEAQKAAEEKLRRERAESCEVARNNLRLLDDPKSQIVEKGTDGAAPMDNTARIEARVLAERQVQDFCR